ncbi:hypothetical protein SMACR_07083 [Sordaria macrospora]|uniref:Zinc finger PHD-type domain-containing protein n=1 Tax=Sordaria macrospora TaxID=5147 RepID=A0A8S8ZN62_SORMA|nr:hypothetical protein SMACR_07083 [Sordaria macrospora]KAH7632157.1 hypothetical protein B0T09DRAFT_116178 [Sordaria sp. MPI-SDFR-AT-0083]WPJ63437.1 hypothetical protein SMAC4_07083 [Sordaria macrospora]
MSGDQLACSSFGDQTAQPPTPTRTPISNTSPTPLLHTPKTNRNYAEETVGWTPGFAKEYSLFISNTPGYPREGEGPSEEFGSREPAITSSGQKGSPSAGRAAAVLTASANPSSSDSAQLLPPVEPLVGLSLPREPLVTSSLNSLPFSNQLFHPAQNSSAQKISLDTIDLERVQTVTPPPSRHKGERKLATRLEASVMQNDQEFVHQGFLETSHPPDMGSYVTNQGDMFNFQLTGTTTGDFANQQPFWKTDPSLEGMDIDFNGASSSLFRQEPHPPSRPMNSLNWETSTPSHFIPENVLVNGGRVVSGGGSEHVMVSQAPMQALMASSADQSMYTGTYATAIDNSFGIINTGVDPGLLFSRPSSASMDVSLDAVAQESSRGSSSRQMAQGAQSRSQGASVAKVPSRGELRRSASEREMEPRKKDKVRATSPVKPIGRPGLGRSLSENRGKRSGSRVILPALAPAPRPQSQLSNGAGLGISRPVFSQPSRSSGRLSPLKSSHQRLSSLTSIPETAGPRTRTQAKFTIDENGRARVETALVVERDSPLAVRKRTSSQSVGGRRRWCSEDDESSSDDEPIIIPSRNTLFSIPDPRKSRTAVNSFSHSQPNFSFSAQSTTSLSSFRSGGGFQGLDDESDEEILLHEMTPTSKMSGDAVNELLKLREDRMRQHKPSPSKMRRLTSSSHSNSTGTIASMNFASRFTASPTALTEASIPTPSSSDATASISQRRSVRCICKRPDLDPGNAFMVQCESCEMWLHGKCVKIASQRALPSIYICAYCANLKTTIPRVQRRGGGNGVYSSSSRTVRQSAAVGKGTPGEGTTIRPQSGSSLGSPLAHKSSFKSFR